MVIAPFLADLPTDTVALSADELVDLIVGDVFELLRLHGIDVEPTETVLLRAETGARVLLEGIGVLRRPLIETITPTGGVL